MSCVVRWWDVLFVNGMHFSSKNARLLNFQSIFWVLIVVFSFLGLMWLLMFTDKPGIRLSSKTRLIFCCANRIMKSTPE